MKQFAATVLLGAVYCEARSYSANSVKVVTELRNHFEKTYGPGLVGLYNEKGEVHGKALAKANRRPGVSANWVDMGGITFNGNDAGSVLYGLAGGFQYKGLEVGGASTTTESSLVESNCFYGMYGLMESVDQLMFDFNNIVDPSGEIGWFNLAVYNPIAIVNNTTVGYEMCDVYSQFDKLSGMFGGDFALMSDYLATDLVFFFTDDGIKAITDMTSLITCGASDAATDAITKVAGQAQDAIKAGTDAKNGGIPTSASGWDTAVADGVNTIDGAATDVGDAAKAAGDVVDAALACEMNFYKIGSQSGDMLSRMMKQKLDESKLP